MIKHLRQIAAAATLAVAAALYMLAPPPPPAAAQFTAQGTWGGTAGGTGNAITINIANVSSLNDLLGVPIRFNPQLDNTDKVTAAVGGTTATAVKRPSSIGLVDFSGGEMLAAETTSITYNGSVFVLTSNVDMTVIGSTVEYRGPTKPRGTLIEDGSCVSRTLFAPLFSVIGTSYSPCDGSTTFGVPDSRGTTFTALDNQGVNGAAGRVTSAGSGCPGTSVMLCGSQSSTLTALQLPVITPTFTGMTQDWQISVDSQPAIPTILLNSGAPAGAGAAANPLGVNGTNPFVRVTPAGTISSFGGGQSHPILDPTLLGRRAIKF